MAMIRPTRDEVSDRFPILGFTVQTGGAPYFEVMLTTDPALPRDKRSSGNFFAAGPLPAERGEAVYLVPGDVLQRFAGAGKLYYGLATFGDGARHGSQVARVPTPGSPYINLHSFTGRGSRRMQITGRSRPARGGDGHGYADRPGQELTWAGDQAQPGAEPIDASQAPPAGSPRNGDGRSSITPAAAPVAQPSGALDYDDGFGPMPFAVEDGGGIEGPIPDTPPEASAQTVVRAQAQTSEYPQASRFVPAAASNYRASASERTINRIVIHITDGGTKIDGPISWFQNPKAKVSAHYIVGQDGEVVQMVLHKDVAWHAGGANGDSIGIEHVARQAGAWTRQLGRPDPGLPLTEAEYCASAALVSWLCDQFGIPKNREHILGHAEADLKTTHKACPNAVWDWDYFMGLVSSGSGETNAETDLPAGPEGQSYAGSGTSYSLESAEVSSDDCPSDPEVANSPSADIPTDTPVEVEEIPYALQDGKVNKIARVERGGGVTTLVFDWAGQERRVAIVDIVDAPPGKTVHAGLDGRGRKMTTLSSIVSYILLYACGKWSKAYGTEIIYEVDGRRWLAKKAVHNDTRSGGPRKSDHPGMDVYVAVGAISAGLGLGRRARALEVTPDSSQAEQSKAVLENIARSMQQKEGTRFNQVHYDSNVVNFGIGSWTGPRIATVLDAYETLATEQGATTTLYSHFGSQSAFNDIRSRFRSNAVGVPMADPDKRALESLGGDTSLQAAQIRLLANEVKKYVDAIALDDKYPFIDGYMNAVTEVAAHVLAHAVHQHGRVNDLITEVVANHGGDAGFGQEITDGTMDEPKFLGEIGEAVVRRVQSQYRTGVRKRYQDLIAQFGGSGLGYFFDPQPATTTAALAGTGGPRYSPNLARGSKQVGRALTDQSFALNWDEVELIAQPTDVSCWAASAAMVVGWRDRISLTPETIAKIAGRTTATGLDPAQVRQFSTEVGLSFESPQSYTIGGFRRLLEAKGPLWVGASVPGLHAIVVTGMYSDGTPDGSDTFVRIADPWDRVVGTPGNPGAYLNTHAHGSRYILTWTDFVREYEAAATDFSSVNLQILHSNGAEARTPTYSGVADDGMSPASRNKGIPNSASAASLNRPSTMAKAAPPPPPRGRAMIAPAAEAAIAIGGVLLDHVISNTGDISWNLDQFRGIKHPNDVAPTPSTPFQDAATIELAEWPKLEIAGVDEISAGFTVDWQYNGRSLGNVLISNVNTNDAAGWGLEVRAQIMDDNKVYPPNNCAALRVRITYRFTCFVGSDKIAVTDLHLYGNGTHEQSGKWRQDTLL